MKILATSDWHLDAYTAGYDRHDDVCAAVDVVVAAAIKLGADLFLFLGDLCDPDPSRAPRCAAKAIEVAERLARAGIRSRWLVGNHDVIEDGSGTSTLEPLARLGEIRGDFRVYSRSSIEALGSDLTVLALPYVPRAAAYDPAAWLRGVAGTEGVRLGRVLVLSHLNCPGIVPASETKEMPRGREVWLPLDFIRETWGDRALILSGHYHRGQVTPDGVVVVGSLARLTSGEERNDPGYLVIEG